MTRRPVLHGNGNGGDAPAKRFDPGAVGDGQAVAGQFQQPLGDGGSPETASAWFVHPRPISQALPG